MSRIWRRTRGGQDEVYLDGQLVPYPLAACEAEGWVRHRQEQDGSPTSVVMVSFGFVEVVRSLADHDPFTEVDDNDHWGMGTG